MKQFIKNIIAMVIALSISAITTVKAQDGLCNDFRTGVSEDYARMMTKDELINEYKNDDLKMKELITLLQWHNIMRGWGFDKITRENAIQALEDGMVRKAYGKMIVARICDGIVEWFPRTPKTRFGGEDVLYITVRGEDIEIASLDCANLIWDKHDVISEETRLTETTADTSTSKGGNASAVATATATASVGDITINVPPAENNNDYQGGYSNYSPNYGYSGGGYYDNYGNYCNYGYGGVGFSAGINVSPFGVSAYAGFGWNNGYYGNSCCGYNTPNFTPSSYTENNVYNNYYGDDDDGDINIFIDNNNTNINDNTNINHTWIGGQEGKPIDPVDPGGPVDPPSGDGGTPVDPVDPGTTTGGGGVDPNGGNDPVDPGSGKTDETTVQTTETFKGNLQEKSSKSFETLSENTNKKVADLQQKSGTKSFETGPATFATNSKVNSNKNNDVFGKQTQLESSKKSFQTETASKIANQTLNSDAKSKFTISNSGKQQNTTLSKTASQAQKEAPRTLKEFSDVALQNKVSNDQRNMSLADKTASVRNDVNQRNGQKTFQDNLSARGTDVNVPQNQSFDRNEMSQKNFNAADQNRNVDAGNKFHQNPNSGSFNKRQDQNPGPKMKINQQQQQQRQKQVVAPAPRMKSNAGNMRPMMKNQNMGLAKAGHR